MPTAPSRPCSQPGCPALQPCSQHYRRPFATAARSTNLYGTHRWFKARAHFLRLNPVCPCSNRATVVDHEPPHRGDSAAFWDSSRFRPSCARCHNAKTGRETRERVRV